MDESGITWLLVGAFYASLGLMWLGGGKSRVWAIAIFMVIVHVAAFLATVAITLIGTILGAGRRL